ncbi:unnamed protein product [Hymenolepis diminuta]|uniref:Bcl-2 Bcl-2 homology region 1-3 domain-containing protein n=1 Tax=Hymenolepis diminuta TaxID=6216 RepID=A0A564Y2P0_HYMDI|nr:unnamed protein product [Hymenolepis diminuta]
MGRLNANILASQIKDQFVNAPQEIRVDFLRKNDQACESEANDFLQTLASFQQEFGQLTSVFDTNVNKSNHSAKRMFDRIAGQSDGTDGSPSAPSITPKISPEKIPQIDRQINVNRDYFMYAEAIITDEWRVVEQLGIIGDKFNEIHGQDIEKLLCVFPVTYKTSDVLCKIFCGLFDSENFSWGRIITFIFFGVRLFCRSIGNYLTALKDLCIEIVNSLKALFARGAFTWIANHGGWRRIISPNSIGTSIRNSTLWHLPSVGTTVGVIGLALAYSIWRSKV